MIQIGKIHKSHLLREVAYVEKYADDNESVEVSQSRYNLGELEVATLRSVGRDL